MLHFFSVSCVQSEKQPRKRMLTSIAGKYVFLMYCIASHQAKYYVYCTRCGGVAYKLDFWDGIQRSPPSRQSGNASGPLNLKNPASLTLDPRKLAQESKESRKPQTSQNESLVQGQFLLPDSGLADPG